MQSKLHVLLVVFSLLVITCASTIKASTVVASDSSAVKVAVYYEAERIDSSEKAKIVDAIGVVESRFEDQIGYDIDLEIVGSWTSRKDTTEIRPIMYDAISKTSGVYTTVYDNYQYEYTWKFSKSGYVAAIYIVEQDLTHLGISIQGAASPIMHVGVVDYNPHGYWYPFDRLCSVTQHELSHIFGLTFYNSEEGECHEPWCVMNYDYMPYEEYAGWWIIRWKTSETWATQWCQNCKNRLIQTYNGITYRITTQSLTIMGNYEAIVYEQRTWTETYYHWELTSIRLKSKFVIGVPLILVRPIVPPSFSYLVQGSLTAVEP